MTVAVKVELVARVRGPFMDVALAWMRLMAFVAPVVGSGRALRWGQSGAWAIARRGIKVESTR